MFNCVCLQIIIIIVVYLVKMVFFHNGRSYYFFLPVLVVLINSSSRLHSSTMKLRKKLLLLCNKFFYPLLRCYYHHNNTGGKSKKFQRLNCCSLRRPRQASPVQRTARGRGADTKGIIFWRDAFDSSVEIDNTFRCHRRSGVFAFCEVEKGLYRRLFIV